MSIGLEVVLLGTGSPIPSANRSGPGQVIVGGESRVLVDCGWGASRRLFAVGTPPASLSAVLFTHLHSDHISDFADLRMMAWTGGRTTPLPVYGPRGTERMVLGFQEALAADTSYRLLHHEGKLSAAGAECEVHEVDDGEVIELGGLKVRVALVDHGQVKPALGYRFERDGQSVVVSGDTNECAALVDLARDADIFVCCAQNREMMDGLINGLRQAGNTLAADLLHDTRTYLASPLDAARMAQAAGVKHLVLSHLTPPIANEGPVIEAFVAGMADAFGGRISVGQDLQRYSTQPG